ncbi:MAG: PAS domain S-box protein, partial [Pyrinomonadaceae bacterium]
MNKRLRILNIEDSESDSALLTRHLKKAGYHLTWERVQNARDLKAGLAAEVWDLILCDYSMPRFSAVAALKVLRESGLDIPFIIISGTIGEEIAVEALLSGANDYIPKGNLARLVPAIERELEQAVNRREKRQAEEARRQSDERYRALFEYAPDGIIISGPDDYYIDANASMCQMLGYDHQELVGMHAKDIVIRSEARELDSEFELVETTPDYNREWHFKRKNGSVFTAEVIATIMPDGNLLAMIRDVTDRKTAEHQLQLHSLLLNSIGQAVIVTDAVGTITYWNEYAAKMYGWESSEVLGRNIVDVTPTDATRAQGMKILEHLKRGERWAGEFTVQDRKGTSFPIFVTNTPLRNAEGQVESIIGISVDVTERKRAEEELRESESLLVASQRITHLGSWVMDLAEPEDGKARKERWSDEHYRIYGFEPGQVEITDEVFYNSVHPDDRERLAATVYESIEKKIPFDLEHRIFLPDGTERTVHAMAEVVSDPETGKV